MEHFFSSRARSRKPLRRDPVLCPGRTRYYTREGRIVLLCSLDLFAAALGLTLFRRRLIGRRPRLGALRGKISRGLNGPAHVPDALCPSVFDLS